MTIKEVCETFNLNADTLRYYERVGAIPTVPRKNGIRDYGEEELKWVQLAICMRSAGVPVEMLIEYVELTRQGDTTITARKELLKRQREVLNKQREQIDAALDRLDFKISRYEIAERAGVLSWERNGEE